MELHDHWVLSSTTKQNEDKMLFRKNISQRLFMCCLCFKLYLFHPVMTYIYVTLVHQAYWTCIWWNCNISPGCINGLLTRYVKLCVLHALGMAGTFFPPPTARKPLVSDPGMHHCTCVTHVPWCMSRSLTRGGGETFPAFPAHVQPAILRIWQEAHSNAFYCSLATFGLRSSSKSEGK